MYAACTFDSPRDKQCMSRGRKNADGSNVYEVNPWLWQSERGKPCLGGLTVEETAKRRVAKDVDRKKRAVETRQHCKADRA
jgi:hypothetical protein